MAAIAARPRFAWRFVHAPQWASIQATGEFEGADIDIRDGYVHMSPASEVRLTSHTYFAGTTDLWLLQIGASRVLGACVGAQEHTRCLLPVCCLCLLCL